MERFEALGGIKQLSVYAHDEKEHYVSYSRRHNGWIIQNSDGFSWIATCFGHALAMMEASSGVSDDDFTVIICSIDRKPKDKKAA